MSITLSVAQLCKHVLKMTVEEFEKKKIRGHFKQNNGAAIKATVAKVWDNLKKLFPCSEKVIEDNVSKKNMMNAVKSLLTGKKAESVVLHTFSEERETRKGAEYLIFLLSSLSYQYFNDFIQIPVLKPV